MKESKEILHSLYVELVKFQKEVINSGMKVLVILEGRDAAGKDGTIKTITKHLSPRETKVVALSKPSDRQQREWYFQRYVYHLPICGEFVIFNRSWYNRLGVEKVMGFCSNKEYEAFFREVELFEQMMVDAGVTILKYYLDISKDEQKKRLADRKNDPLKQWKISDIDGAAQKYWKDYSEARDAMLGRTSFNHSPWFIVDAEDKGKAHIALIEHLLSEVKYPKRDKHLLKSADELVYPATANNIIDRLYR